jgi:L-arabinose isomerase
VQNPGFEETQPTYAADDPRKLIGQLRRLGSAGPAYEIMSVHDAGNVVIEVIESGERVKLPIAEVLEDPMAETIP